MSARKTDMHRLQELVRLHRLGVTELRAAKELRMGRNTAREYRRAIAAAGLLDGNAGELRDRSAAPGCAASRIMRGGAAQASVFLKAAGVSSSRSPKTSRSVPRRSKAQAR
jgi:hypothetical protein